MVKDIQRVMNEIEKLSQALNMDTQEFGQRAMRTSIMSTSYVETENAIERTKIIYRRALSLKLGIAIAEVFETLPPELEGELTFDEFIDKTTQSYMRICGIPMMDRLTRQSEIRGQIMLKLDRSKQLGQIKSFTKSGLKFIKILPEVSETAFAMLLDPLSLHRTPHAKAMTQTIGAMAMIDESPMKLTKYELASTVQDRLNKFHLLEAIKPSYAFNAKHVDPFHIRNEVSFYSDSGGKMFILPTFPETGRPNIPNNVLPVILSDELVFEYIRDDQLKDLTDGFNPILIPINIGDHRFFFNRASRYVVKLEKLLGANFSKFIPKNTVALRALNELQSKLSIDFADGVKVSTFIGSILKERLKDSDLKDFDRRVLSVLYRRMGLITRDSSGNYTPLDDRSETILIKIKDLCNILDPLGGTFSTMATRE